MPSTSALPQKFLRASTQATVTPNGSATAVATIAIRNDRRTAVHSSGVRSNKAWPLAQCPFRHLEVRAKRASKGDGPGRASIEARAPRGHLRMTDQLLSIEAHDVDFTRTVNPYFSNTVFAAGARR